MPAINSFIARMTHAYPHLNKEDTPTEFDPRTHPATRQDIEDLKRIVTRSETRLCKLIVHLGAGHIINTND